MVHPRNLTVLLFDDVELLDFAGPIEVFSVANRQLRQPAFHVQTVAEGTTVTTAHSFLAINAHHTFDGLPKTDLLLVPGGIGARHEVHNGALIDWITKEAASCELVLSVCTGALLLAKARLLDRLEVTTHRVGIDLLGELAPTATVRDDRRFVDNGNVITSAGIAAGIDMSLHVVQRLLGRDVATATARHMEYAWETDD